MSSSMDLRVLMCNQRNGYPLSTSPQPSEISVNRPHAAVGMDASAVVGATAEDAETPPRIKFLCSFGGSILPRPLDGKLRYVGGETRIVSVPRDVSFEELMGRMQDIFEGATLLKYQQPDEDLDALVSVVNDDDVMNMMEEYDKLGAGDGFTRLRLFLFSHPDHDASSRFDSDERETERRYVDALNSLTDSPSEFRKLQPELDKIHPGEQLYGPMNGGGDLGGLHNPWSPECSLPQISVHHIAVPHPLSGQHPQSHTVRYNEMEAPWSPAYYSPGPQPPHDPRSISEFPSSPSSGRYRMPFGDLHDKSMDRMAEEYGRHPAIVDNVVWLPPGVIANEKAGFPGNLGNSHNVFEGNNICEHCRMTFQRHQAMPESRYADSRWMHGQSPIEQSSAGNEFTQFPTPCTECLPGQETYVLSPDTKLEPGIYLKEQNEHRPFYNETHNQERGWVLHHHQMNHRAEEARTHISGAGRVNEHCVVDGGASMNFPFAHENHAVSSNCINRDDPRYIRPGIELGNEGFHDQTVGAGHHMHVSPLEETGIRYGNYPPAYGVDNHYQVTHGSTTMHSIWRKVQNPMRGGPSYEAAGLLPQANGTANPVFLGGEGSPRFSHVGVEDQNSWGGHYCGSPQKVFGFDGSAAPEYPHDHAVKQSSILIQENKQLFALEPVPSQHEMLDISVPPQAVTLVPSPLTVIEDQVANSSISGYHLNPVNDNDITMMTLLDAKNVAYETKHFQTVKEPDVRVLSSLKGDQMTEFDSNGVRSPVEDGNSTKLEQGDAGACEAFEEGEFSAQCMSFLPELIASVKKAALEGAEEVNDGVKGHGDVHASPDADMKETYGHEADPANANNELEHDSDSDHPDVSKIEPTKAEEEALARGLQTIKNDDLEEIRELGSGTYGAVFHGKWKGSDVAIKRIKASCFAVKPSERERLIADFWKEALMLSSLHHPNVVSFYGIVRDGPDGSLATVTEFMVNGSLKQFLQKKDRTIDRRKRLIIAMDAAFGMEYLHGKNIVHFDLKCENLLVNMRDPHRPVCKIGDLGLSKVKQHTLVSGGIRGTLPWMAPELLSGKSNMVTEKIDIYSFGIVMWELLTGEEPYGDMHCASIIGGIVNNTLRPQVPTWCDPEWKSLMESCWSSDPVDRPSFSEISQKLRKMAAAMNVK